MFRIIAKENFAGSGITPIGMMTSKWKNKKDMVIHISGPSCSGKSTLGNKLKENLVRR